MVGVLVALQVEGWRNDLEMQARESAQLAALRADFQENLDRLGAVIVLQDRTVEAVSQLLRIADGHLEAPATDSLAQLFLHAQMFQRLEPITSH